MYIHVYFDVVSYIIIGIYIIICIEKEKIVENRGEIVVFLKVARIYICITYFNTFSHHQLLP